MKHAVYLLTAIAALLAAGMGYMVARDAGQPRPSSTTAPAITHAEAAARYDAEKAKLDELLKRRAETMAWWEDLQANERELKRMKTNRGATYAPPPEWPQWERDHETWLAEIDRKIEPATDRVRAAKAVKEQAAADEIRAGR